MTEAKPISQYAPNNTGERTEFTDKTILEGVPLVITGARTAKGSNGVFWIIQAARQDTGEAVVFTGSTVIDQTMAAVKDAGAFPVAAMLVKVQPETPGANWYWNLVDPPGASKPRGRIDEVGEFITAGAVTPDGVKQMCADIAQTGAKVNDLDDAQYGELLDRLAELLKVKGDTTPRGEEPPF